MLGNGYWNWNKQPLKSYDWLLLSASGHTSFFLVWFISTRKNWQMVGEILFLLILYLCNSCTGLASVPRVFSVILNCIPGVERPWGQANHLPTCYLCHVALQLGFGSFLGIIGSNLVENKRQMVSFHRYRIKFFTWKSSTFLWISDTFLKIAQIGPQKKQLLYFSPKPPGNLF